MYNSFIFFNNINENILSYNIFINFKGGVLMMQKKLFFALAIIISIIFSFSICFAADMLTDATNAVKDTVTNAGNAVEDTMQNAGNAVQDTMNNAGDAMQDSMDKTENTKESHMGRKELSRYDIGLGRESRSMRKKSMVNSR